MNQSVQARQVHAAVLHVLAGDFLFHHVRQSVYNTSKHALVGMTRCVALEMLPHGINVNSICPGVV